MSPTSIAMALAMARAGADGSTASQMDRVLRANGWNDLGSGLGSLQQILNGHNATWKDDEGTSHSLSLNVVNRAFGQDGWPIEQAYLQRIGRAFGAGLGLVDYMRDSSAARDLINGWVARQTANRIPKLLSPTDVTEATRLVLVNAIYLKANWRTSSSADSTQQPPVHHRDGTAIACRPCTCSAGRTFPWRRARAGGDRAPLRGRRRRSAARDDADPPRPPRGLRASLVSRPADRVQAEIAASEAAGEDHARRRWGHALPATPTTSTCSCRSSGSTLGPASSRRWQAMGMPIAVNPERADFSGSPPADATCSSRRSSTRRISTSTRRAPRRRPRQPSWATRPADAASHSPFKTRTLRLDRPFVYLIRDVRTGAILFMGRVLDPTKR